jgi:hypothetical protein
LDTMSITLSSVVPFCRARVAAVWMVTPSARGSYRAGNGVPTGQDVCTGACHLRRRQKAGTL